MNRWGTGSSSPPCRELSSIISRHSVPQLLPMVKKRNCVYLAPISLVGATRTCYCTDCWRRTGWTVGGPSELIVYSYLLLGEGEEEEKLLAPRALLFRHPPFLPGNRIARTNTLPAHEKRVCLDTQKLTDWGGGDASGATIDGRGREIYTQKKKDNPDSIRKEKKAVETKQSKVMTIEGEVQ